MSKIISFEGIDGVGKTSHIKALHRSMTQSGINCIMTRELYGDEFLTKVREMLMSEGLDGYDELLLISLARRIHYRNVIKPAISEGKIILLDRFIESTWAYQGGGRRVPEKILQFFEDNIWDVPPADLTIYLTGTPHRENKQDRFEDESGSFFVDIVNMYEKRQNESWRVLSTEGNFDIVQTMIRDEVKYFLNID